MTVPVLTAHSLPRLGYLHPDRGTVPLIKVCEYPDRGTGISMGYAFSLSCFVRAGNTLCGLRSTFKVIGKTGIQENSRKFSVNSPFKLKFSLCTFFSTYIWRFNYQHGQKKLHTPLVLFSRYIPWSWVVPRLGSVPYWLSKKQPTRDLFFMIFCE